MIQVCASVLIHSNKYMITRRPEGKHLGGYWEFPGGKQKQEETPSKCLKREMSEELGINIIPLDKIFTIFYRYSDFNVLLKFYRTLPLIEQHTFNPVPLEDQDIALVYSNELINYEFVPADKPIINYLKK